MLTGSCAYAMTRTLNGLFGTLNRSAVQRAVRRGSTRTRRRTWRLSSRAGPARSSTTGWSTPTRSPRRNSRSACAVCGRSSPTHPASPTPEVPSDEPDQPSPPATSAPAAAADQGLVVERDLRVPMRDGTVLLADRWAPRSGSDGLPTALIRCPVRPAGTVGDAAGPAAGGARYQVLIQSTRGGFGSGGDFDPTAAASARTAWTPWTGWSSSRGSATRSCCTAAATSASSSGRSRTGCRRRSRR